MKFTLISRLILIGCALGMLLLSLRQPARAYQPPVETVLPAIDAFVERQMGEPGVICGVRVEEIEDPLMQQVRYMDKLVDELAKGRKLDKILRGP